MTAAASHTKPEHLVGDYPGLASARVACRHCRRWVWGEDASVAMPKKRDGMPLYACWPSCGAVGAADETYPARRLL